MNRFQLQMKSCASGSWKFVESKFRLRGSLSSYLYRDLTALQLIYRGSSTGKSKVKAINSPFFKQALRREHVWISHILRFHKSAAPDPRRISSMLMKNCLICTEINFPAHEKRSGAENMTEMKISRQARARAPGKILAKWFLMQLISARNFEEGESGKVLNSRASWQMAEVTHDDQRSDCFLTSEVVLEKSSGGLFAVNIRDQTNGTSHQFGGWTTQRERLLTPSSRSHFNPPRRYYF